MSTPIRGEDRIDNPLMYAPRWARSRPPQPEEPPPRRDISGLTSSPPMAPDAAGITSSPPMAPGIGGFNIEAPPKLTPFEGDVAVKELRRQLSLDPDLELAPPIRVRDNPLGPWLGRLLIVLISAIGAFGLALVMLPRDFAQMRKQDSGVVVTAEPLLESLTRASEAPPSPARLVVESQRAYANEPAPLGVALNDATGGEMLTLVGLAAGTRLSAGMPRGLTGWQVSARELGGAFAHPPKDFIGVMDTAVDLRSANDRLMDSQMVRLEWIQKKPEVRAALAPRREPSAPALVTLEPEEMAMLIKRGQDFLKSGDIPSARLSLRRAANAGSAQAALALGATYDEPILVELGVLGFAPDPAQARAWYERARELGASEAARRLERLAGAAR
jgi:hypothetical protein